MVDFTDFGNGRKGVNWMRIVRVSVIFLVFLLMNRLGMIGGVWSFMGAALAAAIIGALIVWVGSTLGLALFIVLYKNLPWSTAARVVDFGIQTRPGFWRMTPGEIKVQIRAEYERRVSGRAAMSRLLA
jgi:hypothetical protein